MTFGDIEPADSYDAEGAPDPEQVARRLHEHRAVLSKLTGIEQLDDYDELTPAELSLSVAIGESVVGWLITHEPDSPEAAARALHAVRRYWAGSTLPTWDELPDDHRAVGIELMSLLIGWLEREGPL